MAAWLEQDTILDGSVWDFALPSQVLHRGGGPGCDGLELLQAGPAQKREDAGGRDGVYQYQPWFNFGDFRQIIQQDCVFQYSLSCARGQPLFGKDLQALM